MTRAQIIVYAIASLILAASIVHSVQRSKRKPRLTVEGEQERLCKQTAHAPQWMGAYPPQQPDWEHGDDHDLLEVAIKQLNEAKDRKTA